MTSSAPVLAKLERMGSKAGVAGMARYGIVAKKAYGVSVGDLRAFAMDAWVKGFENWADCDTACFHLFDKTPLAWKKIDQWSKRKEEFVKRAAFALLASVALHDKKAPDAPFVKSLKLIERGATDERNFVKKGVSWALRGIGHRNPKLRAAALKTAAQLSQSEIASARWIGKDAIRDLTRKRS